MRGLLPRNFFNVELKVLTNYLEHQLSFVFSLLIEFGNWMRARTPKSFRLRQRPPAIRYGSSVAMR